MVLVQGVGGISQVVEEGDVSVHRYLIHWNPLFNIIDAWCCVPAFQSSTQWYLN